MDPEEMKCDRSYLIGVLTMVIAQSEVAGRLFVDMMPDIAEGTITFVSRTSGHRVVLKLEFPEQGEREGAR
jgi:hypothetical protein